MKAIIFDFDGTILDTEYTELAAWQFVYSEYNHILPLDQWHKRVGSGPENFDPMLYLEHLIGTPVDREAVTKHRRKKLAELVADLQPFPGVHDWLLAASKQGLKLAIVSSSPRYWVATHLERIGFLKYFDFIVTGDDVKKLKPHPEGYQIAIQKLELTPEEVLAIEDSPNGASAALAADLKCIIVPNRVTVNLQFPQVFRTINSLKELIFSEIIEGLTPKATYKFRV